MVLPRAATRLNVNDAFPKVQHNEHCFHFQDDTKQHHGKAPGKYVHMLQAHDRTAVDKVDTDQSDIDVEYAIHGDSQVASWPHT
jgi:hypothetical protein